MGGRRQGIRAMLLVLLILTTATALAAEVYEQAPTVPGPQVVLFSQPFCPGCEAAKVYFQRRGIRYTEFDITSSSEAMATFERLDGRGTPLLLIGGRRLHGFSIPLVEARLQEVGL